MKLSGTAIYLAHRLLDDIPYTNKDMKSIFRISDISRCEVLFLDHLEWKTAILASEFDAFLYEIAWTSFSRYFGDRPFHLVSATVPVLFLAEESSSQKRVKIVQTIVPNFTPSITPSITTSASSDCSSIASSLSSLHSASSSVSSSVSSSASSPASASSCAVPKKLSYKAVLLSSKPNDGSTGKLFISEGKFQGLESTDVKSVDLKFTNLDHSLHIWSKKRQFSTT